MPAVSANFGDLIEPGLKKIFSEQYNQIPEMRTTLFNVVTSDRAYEKESSVGAFGDMPVFTGNISYDDVYQGYDVTYTHAEFAKGFKVERKLFDDDLNLRGHNLAICGNEPKAFLTNQVITGRMKQCVNSQERLWRMN